MPASRGLRGGLFLFCWLLSTVLSAQSAEPAAELLRRADQIKTSDHAGFVSLLGKLDRQSEALSEKQRHYLRYLQGWKHVYDGKYEASIPLLQDVATESSDPTLRFRAGTTVVNVLALATRYKEAFSKLSGVLDLLPSIPDGTAREQGLGVAAYLYNQVGEYELGLRYASRLIEENWAGRGTCNGGQLKFEALYKSGKLTEITDELIDAVDSCEQIGETIYANQIRTYIAHLHIDQGRFGTAVKFLNEHYGEVLESRYPHLTAEYDSLLAAAYHRSGNPNMARRHALSAIENGVQEQHTAPGVAAYKLLYELAQERGDFKLALNYQTKYMIASRAYLDDVSARQIAYEKVKHEILANQLQIDALNKQNEILQLERENNRLYIALLVSILAFIALWAYKTKRLQMHFMRLSQKDGLTGIANRPHFIDRAGQLLELGRKNEQELCVVLCDLDYFKAINDRYGHAAGDFVLKKAVDVCQSQMRPQDLFGRFGGEEFGIVLAGCELDVARQRCDQLRAAIESVTAVEFGMHSNVTASFGIASTKISGYELRMLLAHADSALYQAKREGRNCVVAYDLKRGSIESLAERTEQQAGAA